MAKYKLGEICEFYSGTGFPVTYQGKAIGDFPFYKVGDIANNVVAGNVYLSLCNNYISNQDALEIKGTIIPKDTVVFAKIGEALKLNRRALTSCNCLIDNNAMGIAPKRKFLQTGYFFYFMKNLKLQNFAESTTVPSVRKSKLEQIEIETPPLNTQNEVERTLDKISSLITIRQHQLQKLDELIKARFVELFGDCKSMVSMNELCSIITDGTHQPPRFQESGIPFIFVSNLVGNVVTYNAEKFISEDTYAELYKRTPIEIGDLLLSTVGSYGHPAVVTEDRKFLFQRHIAYLKPRHNMVNSFYLHSALLAPDGQRQIEEKVKGIAQKTLNLSEIKKIVVPLPTIEEQNQFEKFVNQTDKSKVAIQKSLDEAQLLFDSLMQQYFG